MFKGWAFASPAQWLYKFCSSVEFVIQFISSLVSDCLTLRGASLDNQVPLCLTVCPGLEYKCLREAETEKGF